MKRIDRQRVCTGQQAPAATYHITQQMTQVQVWHVWSYGQSTHMPWSAHALYLLAIKTAYLHT